jgi:hypothetical protein
MNAWLLISFCVGNILGPITFTEKSAPEYIPAKIAIVATCAVAVVLTIGLQLYYIWENKRRAKLVREGMVEHMVDIEFADVTDRKNKEFRYQL